MKHKNTQPLYIFNRENPQNSEPQNGPRSGLDYIALLNSYYKLKSQQIRKSFDQINIQFHFDAFNYFYKWQKVLVFSLLQTCYSYIQPNNLSIALINSSY